MRESGDLSLLRGRGAEVSGVGGEGEGGEESGEDAWSPREAIDAYGALEALRAGVESRDGDSVWLREVQQESGSLTDVARRQSEKWMGPALHAD